MTGDPVYQILIVVRVSDTILASDELEEESEKIIVVSPTIFTN